jgi:hypothetical protein
MKMLNKILLACGLTAACLQANANPTMRLSADGGLTWTNVEDNGPLDFNVDPGFITYAGPVGNFTVVISQGDGVPAIGSAITPNMDLGTTDISHGPATLIVQLSDTNFIGFPNETFVASVTTTAAGTLTYNAYRDSGNVLFGTTGNSATAIQLTSQGPFGVGTSVSSNGVTVPNGSGLYSLTLETVITHFVAGTTLSDAFLTANPPPPCKCTLTFNGPASVTHCQGDTAPIPAITATQDCGNGPVSVPVTLTGATTNGSCPAIITLTYSATTDCGDTKTFTQTVTSNCRGNICGHVFADCDASGDLTAGDVGLSNVVVSLIDSMNHLVGKATTDVSGGYCFNNLAGGKYTAWVTPPSGYSQTAASTSYHWKDNYGRICWQENDGYTHCLNSGTECWWDKYSNCHWKDSYNRDCWKDNWGTVHCQPICYQSCNAQTYNNTLCVTLTNCTSQTDVDFAYTGTKPSLSVSCSGPSYVRCGQTCTYTCTVVNTGNVCFKGGNVCTTVGNCNYWGGWNNCNNYNSTCPPLSPGQSCKITVKCSFNSWNCGTVTCQSQANCNHNYGTCSGQSSCYSQCGW